MTNCNITLTSSPTIQAEKKMQYVNFNLNDKAIFHLKDEGFEHLLKFINKHSTTTLTKKDLELRGNGDHVEMQLHEFVLIFGGENMSAGYHQMFYPTVHIVGLSIEPTDINL